MIETFLLLITAHLISDFVLQRDKMAKNKGQTAVLLKHVAIVAVAAAVLAGLRTWSGALAVLVILVTHLVIDWWKARQGDTIWAFVVDQLAHIIVIAALAACLPTLAQDGVWGSLRGDVQAAFYQALAFVSGLIVAVPLGGILVRKLIASIVTVSQQGPPNVGRYIGWLERALTFGFIMVGKPEGVGFLLAAKSVLRIGDLRNDADRSQAEYIIVGTFLSFGWALMIGYLFVWAVGRYARG